MENKSPANRGKWVAPIVCTYFNWRIQCSDGRSTIAVWELSQPEDEFHARLTIRGGGLPVVTEILTTLTLNRVSLALNW